METSVRIWPNFELIQALIHVLITCKYEKDPIKTRFDVYETLCPQQMLVHKGGQIKNWSGECRDVIPTKLQCQAIQRARQSPNLQREIIKKKSAREDNLDKKKIRVSYFLMKNPFQNPSFKFFLN